MRLYFFILDNFRKMCYNINMETKTITIENFINKPLTIELMITRKCCYYCRHCMYDCGPKESNQYMSDEVLKKVKKQINFLKELNINVFINLVGGEPTINFDKFSHILDKVMTWNVSVTMTTNGWWLNSKKNIERFFAIISKYASPDGKSNYHSRSNNGFNIRISDDPFHEEQREIKNIRNALYEIFNDEELIEKYKIPIPDIQDPWLWRQVYDERYYISPNGRGRDVTNIFEWIEKYSLDGNFCMRNFTGFENIHYEPNGDISDSCGYGSLYDFGTVDDNILFIINLIWLYKAERWKKKDIQKFTCSNCREMVKEWKDNNLKNYKMFLIDLNTMDAERFAKNYNYIYGT